MRSAHPGKVQPTFQQLLFPKRQLQMLLLQEPCSRNALVEVLRGAATEGVSIDTMSACIGGTRYFVTGRGAKPIRHSNYLKQTTSAGRQNQSALKMEAVEETLRPAEDGDPITPSDDSIAFLGDVLLPGERILW